MNPTTCYVPCGGVTILMGLVVGIGIGIRTDDDRLQLKALVNHIESGIMASVK